jgi:hypothetical protein
LLDCGQIFWHIVQVDQADEAHCCKPKNKVFSGAHLPTTTRSKRMAYVSKVFFFPHFAAKSAKVFKQMRRAALPAKRGGIIQMTHPRLFVKLDSSSWKRTSVRAKRLDDNDGV